jgi:hypothetical protein
MRFFVAPINTLIADAEPFMLSVNANAEVVECMLE